MSHDGAFASGPDGRPPGDVRLLHAEHDAAFADLTAEFLSRVAPWVDHVAVRGLGAAREAYAEAPFDAVVSDYDLPDGTGIDLLETLRADGDETPFVLFTGKGSESVASEAISAGVTDYLQKGRGTGQFEVLANRVRNAVDRRRLRGRVDRSVAALETANEGIGIVDGSGEYLYVNGAYAAVYGYRPDDLVGAHWERLYPDEEADRFRNRVLPRLVEEGHWTGTATGVRADGTRVPEELALTHTSDGGHICVLRETGPGVMGSHPRDPASPRDGGGARAEAADDPTRLLGRAVDRAADPVCVAAADGALRARNPAFDRLLRADRGPADDAAALGSAFARAVARTCETGEARRVAVRGADGERYAFSLSPLEPAADGSLAAVGIGRRVEE